MILADVFFILEEKGFQSCGPRNLDLRTNPLQEGCDDEYHLKGFSAWANGLALFF